MVQVISVGFTLFSSLLALAFSYPSGSGWQDNSITSGAGSSGWQSSAGWQGASGSSGWKAAEGSSSSAGWQGASGSSGWKAAEGSSSSAGWQGAQGSSDSAGWQGAQGSSSTAGWSGNAESSHNFYDSGVSTDLESRYHGPIALPVVLPDGTIADTPEVASAKAAHLAALEKAKALWYGPKDDGSYDPHKYEEHSEESSHGDDSWKNNDSSHYNSLHTETQGPQNIPYEGPVATPTVLPSGYLADTPSIQAARAAHLTALWKAEEEAKKWKSGWNKWQ